MEASIEFVTAYGPVVLAAMGIVIALFPETMRGKKRFVWVAAFVAVAALTASASWQAIRSTKNTLQETAEAITGGDNYCYLKADLSNIENMTDPVPLLLVNDGAVPVHQVSVWISPASAKGDEKNATYWSIGGFWTPIAYVGPVLAGKALLPGSYRIEISARNGTIIEYLRIAEFRGNLIQTIDIFRNGQKIYSTERPAGFVE